MIKLHFFNVDGGTSVIPLAAALGLGTHADFDRPGRFSPLITWANANIELVDAPDAELIFNARAYTPGPEVDAKVVELAKLGKPIVQFYTNEANHASVRVPAGVLYRASMRKSRAAAWEKPMVAFVEDVIAESGRVFSPRPYEKTPTVGFCGYVGTAAQRWLYPLVGKVQKAAGLSIRHHAMRHLNSFRKIQTRFIVRTQFQAGAAGKVESDAQKAAARREFLDNIFDCDYALCLRGQGNYSFRFYEVLAAGRVPLFINTDCRLPFDDRIDWSKHVCWVDESELEHVGRRLLEFHERLGVTGFAQMQRRNRELWEQFCRSDAGYRHLIDIERTQQTPR